MPAAFDPDLLDRVIWNLVSNAIKFTPAGGTVEVSVREGEGGVVLEVSDTGPGIPAEMFDAVFDRFFRLDQVRTLGAAESPGTGLGLAIVKALVQLHGGEVTASNRGEGGAVFKVTLPRSRAGLPEEDEESFMTV